MAMHTDSRTLAVLNALACHAATTGVRVARGVPGGVLPGTIPGADEPRRRLRQPPDEGKPPYWAASCLRASTWKSAATSSTIWWACPLASV